MDGHPSVTLVPPLLALATEQMPADKISSPRTPVDSRQSVQSQGQSVPLITNLAGTQQRRSGHSVQRWLRPNSLISMPSGLKRNFGSRTKPLHAGICSRSGVTAAHLAADGFTADATAISGVHRFWDLYGPDERDAFSIGDCWALQDEGIPVNPIRVVTSPTHLSRRPRRLSIKAANR